MHEEKSRFGRIDSDIQDIRTDIRGAIVEFKKLVEEHERSDNERFEALTRQIFTIIPKNDLALRFLLIISVVSLLSFVAGIATGVVLIR